GERAARDRRDRVDPVERAQLGELQHHGRAEVRRAAPAAGQREPDKHPVPERVRGQGHGGDRRIVASVAVDARPPRDEGAGGKQEREDGQGGAPHAVGPRGSRRSAAAGRPGRDVAARAPRQIAWATASAAARPRRVRSARRSPSESAKSVSPSKAVWGGESARAKPSIPSEASVAASARSRRALVATTPIVVCSGAAKLPSATAPATARAAASYPISRVGRARRSPTPRSNRKAPGTCGTMAGPAVKPTPRSSSHRITP